MKKSLIYAALLALVTFGFTSCGDEDKPLFAPEQLNKDFGTASGATLSMTYSEAVLTGKQVNFQTSDSKTATITLKDVVPGEAKTVISDVLLVAADKQYTFSGTSTVSRAAGGLTIVYNGSINGTELKLNINVTMPQSSLAKTYELTPLMKGDEKYWVYSKKSIRPPYTYQLVEKTSENTVVVSAGYVAITHTLPGEGSSAKDTISACGITTYKDLFRGILSCMIPQVLQTVTLEKDGNIVAGYSSDPVIFDLTYILKAQDITPEIVQTLASGRTWLQSPKNIAFWYEKEGKLYVKLNIAAIVSQAMGNNNSGLAGVINMLLNSDAATIKKMLGSLDIDIAKTLASMDDATFALLLDWVKNGVPVNVVEEDGHTHFFLDRKGLDPIMAEMPKFIPFIKNMIPDEQSAGFMVSTLESFLVSYGYATKFEIGLDLKAK